MPDTIGAVMPNAFATSYVLMALVNGHQEP
jgi:hypothetical protein